MDKFTLLQFLWKVWFAEDEKNQGNVKLHASLSKQFALADSAHLRDITNTKHIHICITITKQNLISIAPEINAKLQTEVEIYYIFFCYHFCEFICMHLCMIHIESRSACVIRKPVYFTDNSESHHSILSRFFIWFILLFFKIVFSFVLSLQHFLPFFVIFFIFSDSSHVNPIQIECFRIFWISIAISHHTQFHRLNFSHRWIF